LKPDAKNQSQTGAKNRQTREVGKKSGAGGGGGEGQSSKYGQLQVFLEKAWRVGELARKERSRKNWGHGNVACTGVC